ncbi:MAG: IPT/TIG domain-containing protein, partial [Adhaeribacter sp.]
TFVSQSATQLVVKVPNNASKGVLKLVANSGVEVTTTQELAIVLPAITTLAPAPVDPGQELTINGSNLDLVKSIDFQGGTTVSTFVSQTPTRIVVKVPMNAKKGALKLTTHSNYAVATEAQVTIILPVLTAVTPEPVIAGNYLTLSGTELNLVKSVVFADNVLVSSFVAQSNTQIVLAVPATAKTGALKLITHSDFEVATGKQAQIGTAAPNISYYIFENALHGEWQKWGGWGTTLQDLANEEQVSRGAKAIKLSYNDAYGALQLHPNKANVLAGYSHVVLYARGGAADSRLALQVKSSAGSYLADVPFNVKAGEYKLIEIPISALGDVSGGIGELFIKNYGTNPNTVYIDDLGLR